MKILLISDMVGGPGGAYKYIGQIQDYVSDSIDICIVLDKVTEGYVSKNYGFRNVKFIPLSYKYHDQSMVISSIDVKLDEFNPDLVHVINGSIKSNLIIRKHLVQKRIPFVVTEQYIDSSLLLSEELLRDIQEINSNTDHVIYVSKSNQDIANDVFKVKPQVATLIYNAILPVKDKKKIYRQQPVHFYTAARCVPQKGIDTIIRALAKMPNSGVSFDVIGDGEYKEEYIKLADSLLGDNNKFRILGWSEGIYYKYISDNYDLFVSASSKRL